MSTVEWQDRKYHEVFDTVYATTKYRKVLDPDFHIKDLERLISTLYAHEGDNQGGRGSVADIVSSATIAAHEQVLVEWKKDHPSRTD
jgi:hypothetical protein